MLILFELLFAFSCGTQKYPPYGIGFFTNNCLILICIWAASLMFLNPPFHLVELNLHGCSIIIPIAASGYICHEVAKMVLNRIHGVKFPKRVPLSPHVPRWQGLNT